MNKVLLPKEDPELPDNYGITVTYITGKQEEFELAAHTIFEGSNTIQLVTKEDQFHWIPLTNVQRIEFDKRFSKMIAIQEKGLQ